MVMIANASPRNLSAKFGVCCFPSTPPAIEVAKNAVNVNLPTSFGGRALLANPIRSPFIIPRLQTTQTTLTTRSSTRPSATTTMSS
jgi:hypothetical protein